ncbi:MAG: HAD family phosphatase [Fretibacterium sp.]|nr:HAD family phosphatase [Fretibacterium sp.]
MKLFVTDIDDTLSVGDRVSDEVVDACNRLREAGWDIAIATGRTYGSAAGHARSIGATVPAILYDGARVMTLEGEEVHSELFDPVLAEQVLRFLWALPVEVQLTGDESVACRATDLETIRFYLSTGCTPYLMEAPHIPGPVYRVAAWVEVEQRDQVEGALVRAFGGQCEICAGGPQFLDVLPLGVSKGSALERLIEVLPESPELVVAAGDHMNDFELLRRADLSAAPVNAHERLLTQADIVMPEALDHGVQALVEHLLSPNFEPIRRRGGEPLRL